MPVVEKDALYPGQWHLQDGRIFDAKPDDVRYFADRMNEMVQAGLVIPGAWEHQDTVKPVTKEQWQARNAEKAKLTYGHVEGARVGTSGELIAMSDVDDETVPMLKRVKFVSPQIEWNYKDPHGRVWDGPSIVHIAATPRPVQVGQRPFKLSATLAELQAEPIRLSLEGHKPVEMGQWEEAKASHEAKFAAIPHEKREAATTHANGLSDRAKGATEAAFKTRKVGEKKSAADAHMAAHKAHTEAMQHYNGFADDEHEQAKYQHHFAAAGYHKSMASLHSDPLKKKKSDGIVAMSQADDPVSLGTTNEIEDAHKAAHAAADNAHEYSTKAHGVSGHAVTQEQHGEARSAHKKAAHHHGEAAKAFQKAGNRHGQKYHEGMSNFHSSMASHHDGYTVLGFSQAAKPPAVNLGIEDLKKKKKPSKDAPLDDDDDDVDPLEKSDSLDSEKPKTTAADACPPGPHPKMTECLSLLTQAGMPLPDDTDQANIIDRLITSLMAKLATENGGQIPGNETPVEQAPPVVSMGQEDDHLWSNAHSKTSHAFDMTEMARGSGKGEHHAKAAAAHEVAHRFHTHLAEHLKKSGNPERAEIHEAQAKTHEKYAGQHHEESEGYSMSQNDQALLEILKKSHLDRAREDLASRIKALRVPAPVKKKLEDESKKISLSLGDDGTVGANDLLVKVAAYEELPATNDFSGDSRVKEVPLSASGMASAKDNAKEEGEKQAEELAARAEGDWDNERGVRRSSLNGNGKAH